MAKFINKKEQVYDFKMTPYGHYLLSIGRYKPEFYAFFDDNILYDPKYAGTGSVETQNEIHPRIKAETPYLEGQVIFEDIEKKGNTWVDESGGFFQSDVTPTMESPREDLYRIEGMIGDAWLEGDTNYAPAWKVVTMGGTIKSSSVDDAVNNYKIPQLNIEVNYTKNVLEYGEVDITLNNDYREVVASTQTFSDGRIIQLVSDDLLVYTEEVNTALLTENFDIELFEVDVGAIPATFEGGTASDILKRKYFNTDTERIMGGYIGEKPSSFLDNNPQEGISAAQIAFTNTTGSVAYYFDVYRDHEVDDSIACKAVEIYNKDSYYIDLDVDCDTQQGESIYNDIYGPVTEPEICL